MSKEHKEIYGIWLEEEQIKKLNELEEVIIETSLLWKDDPKSATIKRVSIDLPDSRILGRHCDYSKGVHIFMDEKSKPEHRDTLEVYNKNTGKWTRYTTKFAQSQLRIFQLLVKIVSPRVYND